MTFKTSSGTQAITPVEIIYAASGAQVGAWTVDIPFVSTRNRSIHVTGEFVGGTGNMNLAIGATAVCAPGGGAAQRVMYDFQVNVRSATLAYITGTATCWAGDGTAPLTIFQINNFACNITADQNITFSSASNGTLSAIATAINDA